MVLWETLELRLARQHIYNDIHTNELSSADEGCVCIKYLCLCPSDECLWLGLFQNLFVSGACRPDNFRARVA